MLTTNAITGFKNYVKRTISYAKYKIGSSYYNAEITDIYIDSSGRVAIDVTIDPEISGSVTISAIQLYDTSGSLWLEAAASVTKKTSQEGVFYRITVNIYES